MAEQASRPLALFDFDGTLVRLATDYDGLRSTLERLGGRGDDGLLALMLSVDEDPRARRAIAEAERSGLERGAEVEAGIRLYRSFAEGDTTIAVVSHNGREVIESFLASAGLPQPDVILDRSALGAPKDESDAVPAYVDAAARGPVYVVGDAEADRRLAERLGAAFLDVGDPLRSYYDARAFEFDELTATYEHPEPYKRFFYRARFSAVLRALHPQPREAILEIGCGSGAYTRALAERKAKVTATEYAPVQLARARRNLGALAAEVDLRVEDAQRLAFAAETFDKVLLSEVIEHVPDPEAAVAEATRVLRAGGVLVVSTPSRFSPLNLAYGVKRRVRRYAFNEHLHEFTPSSFRRLVSRHLDVESLEFANFLLPYPADELYLRIGSPGLRLLEKLDARLGRLPAFRRLGWTMVIRAQKPA